MPPLQTPSQHPKTNAPDYKSLEHLAAVQHDMGVNFKANPKKLEMVFSFKK